MQISCAYISLFLCSLHGMFMGWVLLFKWFRQRISLYSRNFPIKYVDGMVLLANVQMRRTTSFSTTMEDREHYLTQIRETRKLNHDWTNSPLSQDRFVCKAHYAIFNVIQFFKTIFSESHMRSCTSIKQLTIFEIWKRNSFIQRLQCATILWVETWDLPSSWFFPSTWFKSYLFWLCLPLMES